MTKSQEPYFHKDVFDDSSGSLAPVSPRPFAFIPAIMRTNRYI